MTCLYLGSKADDDLGGFLITSTPPSNKYIALPLPSLVFVWIGCPSSSQEIADWIDEGLVRKPTIDSVHSFTAAGCEEAYQRVKSRRSKGKVVVKVSG